MNNEEYNGWANYATWNVALWLNGDESLHNLTRESHINTYADLREDLREAGVIETPDHVAYNDSALDTDALDELIAENKE